MSYSTSLTPLSSLPQSSSSSAQPLSVNTSPEQPTANLGVKGGTKLSHILKTNIYITEKARAPHSIRQS